MGTQAPSLTGNHSRRGGRGPAATARPCAGLLPLTLALCPPGSKPSQNQAPCFHLGIPVSPCTTVFIFPETARRLRRELHARWPSASPPPPPATSSWLPFPASSPASGFCTCFSFSWKASASVTWLQGALARFPPSQPNHRLPQAPGLPPLPSFLGFVSSLVYSQPVSSQLTRLLDHSTCPRAVAPPRPPGTPQWPAWGLAFSWHRASVLGRK